MLALSSLLLAGAAGGIAIGTATQGGPTVAPLPPDPTPDPGSGSPDREVTTVVAELAALSERLTQVRGLDAARRRLADDLVAAHRAQVVALLSPDPQDRPTDPAAQTAAPPSVATRVDDSGPQGAWRSVAQAEEEAATRLGRWAEESSGNAALMAGGLAAYAAGAAAALRSGADRAPAPQPGTGPVPAIDEVSAMQQVVAQAHAAIFGYQVLLADVSGANEDQVESGLAAYRELRDQLTTSLVEGRNATAPAAEPGYVADDRNRHRLGIAIETGMLPYLGQWLRAAPAGETATAVAALRSATKRSLDWGAPLPPWPGWPSDN